MTTQGGPLKPVYVLTGSDLVENGGDFKLVGRVVLRVEGFDTPVTNRKPLGGQPIAIYLVDEATVDADEDLIVVGGSAIPVVDASDRVPQGAVAIRAYAVNGWTPPSGAAALLLESGDYILLESGDRILLE